MPTSGQITSAGAQMKFPLLVKAAQWVAILSESEASGAIRDYLNIRQGLHPGLDYRFGSEAVEHYGGCLKVIQDAWASRRFARRR